MRALAVALVLLGALGMAHAADNKEAARDAFQEGTRQYDLGDFKAALEAFKKAYLNYEDPAFLYNIAQCQRQLGDKAEALRSYKVFVRKVPSSSVRSQVEKIIAELQAAIDQEKAAKAAPPTGTAEPSLSKPPVESGGAATATGTPSTGGSSTATPPENQATTLTAQAPEKKPITKRGWFWGVVAGGAVVVAGAVTLGVVLGTRHSSPIELTY